MSMCYRESSNMLRICKNCSHFHAIVPNEGLCDFLEQPKSTTDHCEEFERAGKVSSDGTQR